MHVTGNQRVSNERVIINYSYIIIIKSPLVEYRFRSKPRAPVNSETVELRI